MKKFILIGAIAFGVVILAAYFFKIEGAPVTKEVPNSNYYPIVIYAEKGELSYKLPTENNFVKASSTSIKVPNMTIIQTGSESRGTVLLPDNSMITLIGDTEVTVNYSDTKVSIFQAFGTTYHRVEKLVTGGSYQVQTPETLAAVRGTKFAVQYDKKTKKTKVSVTESQVEVSKTFSGSLVTNTEEQKESQMIKEGETAVVEAEVEGSPQEKKFIVVIKTDTDEEVQKMILEEKKKDTLFESIKKDISDKEVMRDEMEKIFLNDEGFNDEEKKQDENFSQNIQKKNVDEVIKEQTRTPESVNKQDTSKEVLKDEVVSIKNEITINVPAVTTTKKINEEAFFTQFETVFVDYFYLDDKEVVCSISISPEEKLKKVTSFANDSGYPFTKSTSLLSFAQAINGYCLKKDPSVKASLQARFDEEYPF